MALLHVLPRRHTKNWKMACACHHSHSSVRKQEPVVTTCTQLTQIYSLSNNNKPDQDDYRFQFTRRASRKPRSTMNPGTHFGLRVGYTWKNAHTNARAAFLLLLHTANMKSWFNLSFLARTILVVSLRAAAALTIFSFSLRPKVNATYKERSDTKWRSNN